MSGQVNAKASTISHPFSQDTFPVLTREWPKIAHLRCTDEYVADYLPELISDQLDTVSPSFSFARQEVEQTAGVVQPPFTGDLVLLELLDVVQCLLIIVLQLLQLGFDRIDFFLFPLYSLLSDFQFLSHFHLLGLQRSHDKD